MSTARQSAREIREQIAEFELMPRLDDDLQRIIDGLIKTGEDLADLFDKLADHIEVRH